MEIKNPYLAKMATGNAEDDLFLLRFSMYLHTIVRETAGAYWAKQRKLEDNEIIADLGEIDDALQTSERYYTQEAEGLTLMENVSDELLLTALKALTEKQRNVLTDYVVQDCPVAEIARRRQTSPICVYKLLTRALQNV